MFRLSLYDYRLPVELIAQKPVLFRDNSRLMVLDKNKKNISHKLFKNIVDFLEEGDLLVLNNSRVIPARLMGKKVLKTKTKGADCEVLLLQQETKNTWECLVRPGKRLKIGARISFGRDELQGEIIGVTKFGSRKIRFECQQDFYKIIEDIGLIPLPPYIKNFSEVNKEHELAERYQTIYAEKPGSVAAPTAGLHFTEDIFEEIHDKGVRKTFVTLHTGLGTFKPIETEDVRQHNIHKEWFEVNPETIELILKTQEKGGRVIAVGTTSARVLEAIADKIARNKSNNKINDYTDLFIYPGYKFKTINGLITNFHLPKSSLLVLVAAFAGREFVMQAYQEAIKEKYRFYSFGDAMLIY